MKFPAIFTGEIAHMPKAPCVGIAVAEENWRIVVHMDKTRPGRPPLKPELARNKRVVMLVTAREWQKLRELADGQGVSLSSCCHRIISTNLDKQRRKQ